jgi:acetylornithine/succinyldiaminopimelate/putrescine aminotransferase
MAFKVKKKNKVKSVYLGDKNEVAKLYEKKKVLGVVVEGVSGSYTVWYKDK